jgi:hypothetical protein
LTPANSGKLIVLRADYHKRLAIKPQGLEQSQDLLVGALLKQRDELEEQRGLWNKQGNAQTAHVAMLQVLLSARIADFPCVGWQCVSSLGVLCRRLCKSVRPHASLMLKSFVRLPRQHKVQWST